MTDAREQTRNERLLSLISSGWLSMNTLTRLLDCPDASVRRSIQELRREGYYIVLDQGQARSYGKRSTLLSCQDESHESLDPSNNVGGDDDVDYQR
jgi:biotin operon repressor